MADGRPRHRGRWPTLGQHHVQMLQLVLIDDLKRLFQAVLFEHDALATLHDDVALRVALGIPENLLLS